MSDISREGTLSINGICPQLALTCPLDADDSKDGRLTGNFYLSQPLLVDAITPRRLHKLKFIIQPCSTPAEAPIDDDAEYITFGRKEGAILFIDTSRPDVPGIGEITLSLEPTAFENLRTKSQDLHALTATIYIRMEGYYSSLKAAEGKDYLTRKIYVSGLQLSNSASVPSKYVATREAQEIEAALSSCYLSNRSGSQVALIVDELSASAGTAAVTSGAVTDTDAIRSLLKDARPAFLKEVAPVDEQECNLWYDSPTRFQADLEKRSPDEAASLRTRYDTLWYHFDAAATITNGEVKYGPALRGFEPKVSELELLAAKLIALAPTRSAVFEWALVNALIYCECIAFAQSFLSGEKVFGITVPGELKGTSSSSQGWKAIGGSIWSFVAECLKITATFAVAVVLAQENLSSAWVITTGVTAARWIRRGLKGQEPTVEMRQRELLRKMLGCQHLVKEPTFNARALRDLLYRVTAEGAVFSPWIFNILDARIRAEESSTYIKS